MKCNETFSVLNTDLIDAQILFDRNPDTTARMCATPPSGGEVRCSEWSYNHTLATNSTQSTLEDDIAASYLLDAPGDWIITVGRLVLSSDVTRSPVHLEKDQKFLNACVFSPQSRQIAG